MTFVQAIIDLVTFVHINNIAAATEPILPNFDAVNEKKQQKND